MKKAESIAFENEVEDRIGRRIAACLDASTEELHHDITERLRIARQQALTMHRQARLQQAPALQLVAAGAAGWDGAGETGRWWQRLMALLPLAALIAGLIAIQIMGTDDLAREMAEIDEAILTDDLPPDAYTDPGFAQFLKNRLAKLNQDR